MINRFELFDCRNGYWLCYHNTANSPYYSLVAGRVSVGRKEASATVIHFLDAPADFKFNRDLVFLDLNSAKAFLFDNNFTMRQS